MPGSFDAVLTGRRNTCTMKPAAKSLAGNAGNKPENRRKTTMKRSQTQSTAQLEALRQIDTPTVCNAIETFKVRGRLEGFCGLDVRCLSPELGVMVGYAVTLPVDASTPGAASDSRAWYDWMQAMAP